jgi:hypothetical protein
VYADVNSGLSALQAELEGQAEQDKWLALAQMGMGIASGTSPYFATNVGEGGAAGIDALNSARSDARQREMAMLAAQADLAKGQEQARSTRFGEEQSTWANEQQLAVEYAKLANDEKKLAILAQKSTGVGAEGLARTAKALKDALDLKQTEREKFLMLHNNLSPEEQEARKRIIDEEVRNLEMMLNNVLMTMSGGVGASLDPMSGLKSALAEAIEKAED